MCTLVASPTVTLVSRTLATAVRASITQSPVFRSTRPILRVRLSCRSLSSPSRAMNCPPTCVRHAPAWRNSWVIVDNNALSPCAASACSPILWRVATLMLKKPAIAVSMILAINRLANSSMREKSAVELEVGRHLSENAVRLIGLRLSVPVPGYDHCNPLYPLTHILRDRTGHREVHPPSRGGNRIGEPAVFHAVVWQVAQLF